jgi:hypothetical protein
MSSDAYSSWSDKSSKFPCLLRNPQVKAKNITEVNVNSSKFVANNAWGRHERQLPWHTV